MAIEDLSGIGGTGASGIIGGGGGGGGATLGDVANAYTVRYITLSLADIVAGFATLPEAPESPVKTKVEVIEGLPADYGVDYTVDTGLQQVQWAGLGLAPFLAAGDKLRITYFSI